MSEPLRHPLLEGLGVVHGFGRRDSVEPAGLRRPRQVHGIAVTTPGRCARPPLPEADAIVSAEPGRPVGIATADCVPILVARNDGQVVGAIHAGWRGLAAGVIGAAMDALRQESSLRHFPRAASFSGDETAQPEWLAAIGPHIGPCCYEVDSPVIGPLLSRFGEAAEAALAPARVGHAMLDLGGLAAHALALEGVSATAIGMFDDACTACRPDRYHSYRRDGARSGRLIHSIEARHQA